MKKMIVKYKTLDFLHVSIETMAKMGGEKTLTTFTMVLYELR